MNGSIVEFVLRKDVCPPLWKFFACPRKYCMMVALCVSTCLEAVANAQAGAMPLVAVPSS